MKSRRTKACEIPPKVKENVYLRDGCHCLGCARWVPESKACAHYIARAHGGLGIEENILTLCDDCHNLLDKVPGERSERLRKELHDYLAGHYGEDFEKKCVYDKWGDIFGK